MQLEEQDDNIKEYPVNYHLSQQFRDKVECEGCKVYKVVELKNCRLLLYMLVVPDGKDELISDMAFMTHIRNPKFQKHYVLTEDIIAKMQPERENIEEKKDPVLTDHIGDQTLARLVLGGFYPFYSSKLKKFMYFKDHDGKLIGTGYAGNFKNLWDRQINFLGAGQLSLEQIDELKRYKIPI